MFIFDTESLRLRLSSFRGDAKSCLSKKTANPMNSQSSHDVDQKKYDWFGGKPVNKIANKFETSMTLEEINVVSSIPFLVCLVGWLLSGHVRGGLID